MALRVVAFSLVAMFALSVGQLGGQDAKKDLELIQGTWTMDRSNGAARTCPRN